MSKREMEMILFKDAEEILALTNGKIKMKDNKKIGEKLKEIKDIYNAFNHRDKYLFINTLNSRIFREQDMKSQILLDALQPIILDEMYCNFLDELTPYLSKRNNAEENGKKYPSYLSVESYRTFVKQKIESMPIEVIESLQKRAVESFKTGKYVGGDITINHIFTLASILCEVKDKKLKEKQEMEEQMLDKELQENLL